MHKEFSIRPLRDTDSLADLTALLHASYAEHAAAGRTFFASYQSVDDTRHRVAKGECWLAFDGDVMAGTVTIAFPHLAPQGYPAGVHSGTFYQMAVLPEYRGRGLGDDLLSLAERRLTELGATDVVIDTSSLASELIAWYERRGYVAVGRWRWNVTNYESVVLRKLLRA
jgi:ribosomal protein S18 acetylase RimI-like enzyme